MTPLLSKKDRAKLSEDIEFFKLILPEILDVLKSNLLDFDGRRVNDYKSSLLNIILRFRLQIDALTHLMVPFEKDYRLKSSVNLILRCLCADALTGLYLVTFYSKDDPENLALKNELDVLGAEYLHFVKKSISADHEILASMGMEDENQLQEKFNWFNNLDPDLIDDDGKVLSKKLIRQSTPDNLKSHLDNKGSFISEEQKYEHIKKFGLGHYGFIFVAFKYYSQFHHFNPMSKRLIELKPLHDTFYMGITIELILKVAFLLFKISGSCNENLQEKTEDLVERIKKHFA